MPKTIDEFAVEGVQDSTAAANPTIVPPAFLTGMTTPRKVADGAISTVDPVKATVAFDLIEYDISDEVRHINVLLSEQWTDYERVTAGRRVRPFNRKLSEPAGEAVCRAYRAAGWRVVIRKDISAAHSVSSLGTVDYFQFFPQGI